MPTLTTPAVDLRSWRGTGQPNVSGDGVRLRPWDPADVDVLVRAYADPGIQRWHVRTMTTDEAARWIGSWPERWQAGTGADWAVTDADDGTVLGRVGFRSVDLYEGEAELVYWVLPEARGRRVAPRALQALLPWADGAGLTRIALRHSVDNAASCRVAERGGFTLEGTLRRAGRHADGAHDMHLHARVRD